MKTSTNILTIICAAFAVIALIAGVFAGRLETVIIAGLLAYVAAGFRKSYRELKEEEL